MHKNNQLVCTDLLWRFCSLDWRLASKIGASSHHRRCTNATHMTRNMTPISLTTVRNVS